MSHWKEPSAGANGPLVCCVDPSLFHRYQTFWTRAHIMLSLTWQRFLYSPKVGCSSLGVKAWLCCSTSWRNSKRRTRKLFLAYLHTHTHTHTLTHIHSHTPQLHWHLYHSTTFPLSGTWTPGAWKSSVSMRSSAAWKLSWTTRWESLQWDTQWDAWLPLNNTSQSTEHLLLALHPSSETPLHRSLSLFLSLSLSLFLSLSRSLSLSTPSLPPLPPSPHLSFSLPCPHPLLLSSPPPLSIQSCFICMNIWIRCCQNTN